MGSLFRFCCTLDFFSSSYPLSWLFSKWITKQIATLNSAHLEHLLSVFCYGQELWLPAECSTFKQPCSACHNHVVTTDFNLWFRYFCLVIFVRPNLDTIQITLYSSLSSSRLIIKIGTNGARQNSNLPDVNYLSSAFYSNALV